MSHCYYRILQSWNTRLEKTSRTIWFKFPWQKHSLDKMAQHPVQMNCKSIQHLGIQCFHGRLLQWLGNSMWKNLVSCLIRISPRVTCFHYPLCLLCDYLWKRESPSSLEAPLKYWNVVKRCPLSLLFSRLNKPSSLSFSSHARFLSPLIIFVALF